MRTILSYIKKSSALVLLVLGIGFLTSCNKDIPSATPIPQPDQPISPTIGELLNNPSFSILKSAVVKAGLLPALSDPTLRFTVFAPDNNAFMSAGLSQAVINALPVSTVTGLVSYHVVPQSLPTASIPTSFPNLQYPTLLNPAPSVSALLRLTTFPSKRGSTSWVNNIDRKTHV